MESKIQNLRDQIRKMNNLVQDLEREFSKVPKKDEEQQEEELEEKIIISLDQPQTSPNLKSILKQGYSESETKDLGNNSETSWFSEDDSDKEENYILKEIEYNNTNRESGIVEQKTFETDSQQRMPKEAVKLTKKSKHNKKSSKLKKKKNRKKKKHKKRKRSYSSSSDSYSSSYYSSSSCNSSPSPKRRNYS